MSFYYPFESLVRLADLVSNDENQDLTQSSTSNSNSNNSHPHSRSNKLTQFKKNKFFQAVPKMDLIENKDLITAIVELPGLTKDKVNISLHDNVLTISGSIEHTQNHETSNYKSIERNYGSFNRSIAVPPGLKEEEIKAKLENGLLKVEIPKIVKESEVKKIEIS